MSFSPKRVNTKVDKIVRKYTVLLRYLTLGPASLKKSELKMLIQEGLLSPKFYQPTIGDTYLEAHVDLLRDTSRKTVRSSALKYLKEHAGQFIDKFATKASTDIGTIINQNLLIHNQQMKSVTKDTLASGVATHKAAKRIAQELRAKTKDLYKDWDRVVTTEMAQAQNLGALDAITENSKGKAHNEIYVYKIGVIDDKRCKVCEKLWTLPDGVTPKVYRLSELTANGTNYGKKTADWKATVETTHPNCRDFLMELPISWGFQNGALTYIKEGWNECKKQRN